MTPESSKQTGGAQEARHESDGARALAAAVTQIELALREAHAPVEQLGLLVERMARSLGGLRTARARESGADPGSALCDDVDRSIGQLQADLYEGIRQLQFYDRMVQHLSHVQDYLSSVANQLASAAEGRAAGAVWDDLCTRLRARLISDAQRELLDMVLIPAIGTPAALRTPLPEHASQGSVELF
jgi:methyl-accepting chemotaxis protein